MTNPKINVTPLIDVLLVLLIIFMVVSPARPSRFETKMPSEMPDQNKVLPNPQTLIVTIGADSALQINKQAEMGNVAEPEKLTSALTDVFRLRAENAARDAVDPQSIERTVFIKARSSTSYGDVAKIVDAVKASGASPISLIIDGID
ncbi:MAG: biopolymer transporter ExbD [Acidobacteriota bacterium]